MPKNQGEPFRMRAQYFRTTAYSLVIHNLLRIQHQKLAIGVLGAKSERFISILRCPRGKTQFTSNKISTSRDRPKSVPYPRLKNSRRTSKFQSILFYSTKKIYFEKVSKRRKKLKGGPFGIFLYPVCRKTQK